MFLITHFKRILPLKFKVWFRRDAKHIVWRLGQRLRGRPTTPPPELIYKTIGVYDPKGFIASGADSVEATRDVLREAGVRAESLRSVLDFGSGAGRLIHHWKGTPELHGCDYNPELVGWCGRNLPFAEFRVNPVEGPLPYEDESFDLVYSYSVFTHLPETLQKPWMSELRRVLKPGGLLYLTLHGESCLGAMGERGRADFSAGRFVCSGDPPGSNSLAAYHPEVYVRGEFSEGFEVLAFRPEGARGGSRQDAYLLRKA